MSFLVTDAFVAQYSGTLRFLAQQSLSRFQGHLIEEMVSGEQMYLEQVAPSAAARITVRHMDSPVMSTQHLRRMVVPYGYVWGDLVDREDQARALIDLTSAYTMTGARAMARAYDDEAIAGFWGVSRAGHAGATSLTWPNGNSESTPTQPAGAQIAVNDWTYGNGSGNAGLTVSKLISAQVALGQGEGDDEEEWNVAYSWKRRGNLLATTEFTDSLYNEVKELTQRRVGGTFLGFNHLHTERNALDSNGYERVPAWRKSGMGMGILLGIDGRVAERPDKNFSTYCNAMRSLGSSRLEEVKIAEIKCL